MSTPHQDLMRRIRLKLGEQALHCRLFQNVRGLFWQGTVKEQGPGWVTLVNPVRKETGLAPGSLDLIGWVTITITPDMVGQKIAVFTAGDAKVGRDKLSDLQANFARNVIEAGGRAAELRSEQDVLRLVAVS
jgi:hypothetical protein